jgi:hypothetical protein
VIGSPWRNIISGMLQKRNKRYDIVTLTLTPPQALVQQHCHNPLTL